MPPELETFHREFFQELIRDAHANGRHVEDTFFELFCEQLVDAGELETADRVAYNPGRGIRVDGYGGDPVLSEGTLSLIVADFNQTDEVVTLTATEMEALFRRATTFLSKSLDLGFRNALEETSPEFGLADLIKSSWNVTTKVRIFLITNRVLSSRVDGRASADVAGTPVVYSVWDLQRLNQFVSSGRGREEIVVEMEQHGGSVPSLPAHLGDAGYEAYLLVLPGRQLASVYDRWGARLLEQNVRVFLQARGTINKRIRQTIENDAGMFFAYNNGITATAEEVVAAKDGGTLLISRIRNLQIVNGGQTTASIYEAFRRKVDLSKVFVQMKLSIIPHDRAQQVVPKISEYANSQNKVNAADFFANHPYHLRFKEMSERLFAPSRDGTFRHTKWFYDRARGQYQEARGRLSAAELRKFDFEYPKAQVISKTDLAKFLTVWDPRPDIVSKGAQKNFAHFAAVIGELWGANPDSFNEGYYRESIAKAIVFREMEALIPEQTWYDGGYRANIVAYGIAKLAHDVKRMGYAVDFERIWRNQQLSEQMRETILTAAEAVKEVLVTPIDGVTNVTEWAKMQGCWDRVAALSFDWPKVFLAELITDAQRRSIVRDSVKDQRLLNGVEAQIAVHDLGADQWREVKQWGVRQRLLSQKEMGILDIAIAMPRKLPSEKQSIVLIETLTRLVKEGCPISVNQE